MPELPSILTRRVEQVLPSAEGLAKIMAERKIRLYLGIDPTSNQLHLGHAVVLRKLQEFAEAGQEVILLIGNGTVKIGDPTGKDKTRPVLTDEIIEQNFLTWKEQASKILDFEKIQIRYNAEWLDKLDFPEMVKLLSRFTVQQLLERDMFQERMKNGQPIHMHEILYPVMQDYDAVVMDVDLELGGNDQLFNMMVGRQLQADMNNRDKYVLTVPLLVGSDGRKMGKSLGNFIPLTDTPEDMYGKLMSITDDVMGDYARLLTDISLEEIESMESAVAQESLHPMEMKKRIAAEIVTWLHGAEAAERAAQHFASTVQDKEIPQDIPELSVESAEISILDLVMQSEVPSSRSEARRLIEQGGVELESQKYTDPTHVLVPASGQVLRVGKRNYFRITA